MPLPAVRLTSRPTKSSKTCHNQNPRHQQKSPRSCRVLECLRQRAICINFAAEIARAQSGREHLAIHARQLALEPRLQILRRCSADTLAFICLDRRAIRRSSSSNGYSRSISMQRIAAQWNSSDASASLTSRSITSCPLGSAKARTSFSSCSSVFFTSPLPVLREGF
jgi:hypothetical protein